MLSRFCAVAPRRFPPSICRLNVYQRNFSKGESIAIPSRKPLSVDDRRALRASRKAGRSGAQQEGQVAQAGQGIQGEYGGTGIKGGQGQFSEQLSPLLATFRSKYIWYLAFLVPSGIFAWAYNDETSPPAKFFESVGISGFFKGYSKEVSKPVHDKLLPDWNEMPNVPHDIPVPHTLVLDLEQTLVSASWERKTGWRYAKRPGVDKFLHVLAQYYEIVVYSPSVDAVADPVISILDKSGCVMHRLYRDATHFHKGVHVKDLNRLNRDVNRMILLDDEPQAAAFNPDNLIQVKPYLDPTDQSDNTLERITPFLVEIARKGYSDIPTILSQYRGMNSDQIADEYERRIDNLRSNRMHSSSLLGGFASRSAASLPPPEMTPSSFDNDFLGTKQITAKDVVGAGPPSSTSNGSFVQWMNRRSKEKEEEQMRKMEKWNEVMMKKQQAKQAEASRT